MVYIKKFILLLALLQGVSLFSFTGINYSTVSDAEESQQREILISPDGNVFLIYLKNNQLKIIQKRVHEDNFEPYMIDWGYRKFNNISHIYKTRTLVPRIFFAAESESETGLYLMDINSKGELRVRDDFELISKGFSGIHNTTVLTTGSHQFEIYFLHNRKLEVYIVDHQSVVHKPVSENEIISYSVLHTDLPEGKGTFGYFIDEKQNITAFSLIGEELNRDVLMQIQNASDITLSRQNISEPIMLLTHDNRIYSYDWNELKTTQGVSSMGDLILFYEKSLLKAGSYNDGVLEIKNHQITGTKFTRERYKNKKIYFLNESCELSVYDSEKDLWQKSKKELSADFSRVQRFKENTVRLLNTIKMKKRYVYWLY